MLTPSRTSILPILGITLAVLIFFQPGVQAQVAAPSLIPGFTSDNPAALQWSGPSRIGGAYFKSESTATDIASGVEVGSGESKGALAGLALVGETTSLGMAVADFKISDSSGNTLEISSAAANIALQLGDSAALGGALEKGSASFQGTISGLGAGTGEFESDITLGGVSIRLLDIFYLGYAYGTESQQQTLEFPAFPLSVTGDLERILRRYGVALFSRAGTKWHLEISEKFNEFAQDTVTFISSNELKETRIELEVQPGALLLGVNSVKTVETDKSVSPATSSETNSKSVTLGWVPDSGWSLILVASKSENDDGTTVDEGESFAVFLGYLF